jgi:hypothetical protein
MKKLLIVTLMIALRVSTTAHTQSQISKAPLTLPNTKSGYTVDRGKSDVGSMCDLDNGYTIQNEGDDGLLQVEIDDELNGSVLFTMSYPNRNDTREPTSQRIEIETLVNLEVELDDVYSRMYKGKEIIPNPNESL